jgi:hypothetical protein
MTHDEIALAKEAIRRAIRILEARRGARAYRHSVIVDVAPDILVKLSNNSIKLGETNTLLLKAAEEMKNASPAQLLLVECERQELDNLLCDWKIP